MSAELLTEEELASLRGAWPPYPSRFEKLLRVYESLVQQVEDLHRNWSEASACIATERAAREQAENLVASASEALDLREKWIAQAERERDAALGTVQKLADVSAQKLTQAEKSLASARSIIVAYVEEYGNGTPLGTNADIWLTSHPAIQSVSNETPRAGEASAKQERKEPSAPVATPVAWDIRGKEPVLVAAPCAGCAAWREALGGDSGPQTPAEVAVLLRESERISGQVAGVRIAALQRAIDAAVDILAEPCGRMLLIDRNQRALAALRAARGGKAT